MIRTYLHQCSANQNKQMKIEAILVPYRTFAEKVAVWQWRLLQEGGNFYKNTSIKHLPSVLSARYKQTIQYQVVGSLKGYLENRKNDFISMVRGSTLSEDIKIELFFINKHGKGFAPSVLMQGRIIPCSTLKLARRNLQKQGIKLSDSRRYKVLVSKVRSWLKNEIHRIMNRLIKIHKPAEIVIERLNFQNSHLSRRLNRIISKFGKGIFKAKLESLTETFGILITEINPAYTSQECVCGYVDKRNRLRQAIFKCKVCKTECNADIKAGKVVLRRSKDTKLSYLYIRKVELLDVLVSRFMDKLRIERKVFTHLCHNSLAQVLTSNPYFKRFRSEIKEIYGSV
jgi:putative transposase